MKASPAFQFYPSDFLMGTAMMTCEQRGAYIVLLCHQWHSLGLPENNHMLSSLANCDVEVIEAVICKFTLCEDGLLRNMRLEEIRSKLDTYRESRSINGKKGGRPKKAYGKHSVKHTESTEKALHLLSSSSSLTPTSTLTPKDIGANGSPPVANDDEWLAELSGQECYQGIDVSREFGKMKTWCSANKKQPTRRRFANWLNRTDKPMTVSSKPELEHYKEW